jgi:hypothetical protein
MHKIAMNQLLIAVVLPYLLLDGVMNQLLIVVIPYLLQAMVSIMAMS